MRRGGNVAGTNSCHSEYTDTTLTRLNPDDLAGCAVDCSGSPWGTDPAVLVQGLYDSHASETEGDTSMGRRARRAPKRKPMAGH